MDRGVASSASVVNDPNRGAAPAIGLQIQTLNARTIGEIDAAFATLARERPDALLVGATHSSSTAACNLPF
jgi:hypothetical protein